MRKVMKIEIFAFIKTTKQNKQQKQSNEHFN